jgi:ABC-type polysaccharide/polyol phosphate transport system ATPase subunit
VAEIITESLSVHYPLTGTPGNALSGPSSPGNIITVGRKRYILALRNLNLHIRQGERVGIVGSNGSGKSTLLRVLGGIYPPTAGSLVADGTVSSLFNLNLGVQADATGRENIVIRGLLKGLRRQQINARMQDIIEFAELEDVIDLPLRTYSAGMRMRLLFAIATSFSPEILLLDEWIGAGDSNFQKKAAERMNTLVSQAGITVIASHSRGLLRKVCDLGLWLDAGRVRAFGPIEEVFAKMDAEA